MNWDHKRTEFWHKGYTVFDGLIPEFFVRAWRTTALEYAKHPEAIEGVQVINKTFDKEDASARDGRGSYNLISINGLATLRFSGLGEFYKGVIPFLSLFTGLDIVESFDPVSAVTVMVYPPPAGQMLAHYDTNSLTFLLYLTDNIDGGTEVLPLTSRRPTILGQPDEIIGPTEVILPKAGRVVLMNGRRVWHRALPVTGAAKISSAWNYYERGDNFRPAQVSERLYK